MVYHLLAFGKHTRARFRAPIWRNLVATSATQPRRLPHAQLGAPIWHSPAATPDPQLFLGERTQARLRALIWCSHVAASATLQTFGARMLLAKPSGHLCPL